MYLDMTARQNAGFSDRSILLTLYYERPDNLVTCARVGIPCPVKSLINQFSEDGGGG